MITQASLFTGIGVWDYAAHNLNWQTEFMCEIDKRCRIFLRNKFKNVHRFYGDIKESNFLEYENKINVLTISDPCQSLSNAGYQRAEADSNYLWPEAARAIREIKPKYIILENVDDRLHIDLDRVIYDLEAENYTVEPPLLIPALSQGARHTRYRLFLVAYSNQIRWTQQLYSNVEQTNTTSQHYTDHTLCPAFLQFEKEFNESPLLRVVNGASKRLHIPWRIGAIGNAVYYPTAFSILQTINKMINHEINTKI